MSQDGIDLAAPMVAAFEGVRLKAYVCPAGVLTIGYGHTAGVKKDQKCTMAQAREWLAKDLSQFAETLDIALKRNLEPHQYAAVLSILFNVGAGGSARSGIIRLQNGAQSSLLRFLNDGRIAEASQQFGSWVNIGGKSSLGLIRRRAVERAMFDGDDWRDEYVRQYNRKPPEM